MVDKNLFLHDLAVTAILKCEGHYLKEWLDYHLAAGVDHFYLYDNESLDNQREVAEPYIAAGLVDYIFAPGKVMQMATYNDAVNRFKFQSLLMAFIDGDEFIFPKMRWGGACNIVEIIDEILSRDKNAAGVAINWQLYGSNGQETADYSRGVLERFTRRDKNMNKHVKTIANPRTINFLQYPHFANYFEGLRAVNEQGKTVETAFNQPATADKIVINHYHCKSREEYAVKHKRGRSDTLMESYKDEQFKSHDRNDEFDDSILKYRDERAKTYRPPDKSHADERLFNALTKNLSPTLIPYTPPKFYAGKLETFLTCRAVAAYLKTRLTDSTLAKNFEEAALKAILRSLGGMSFADARLFIRELPKLFSLPYPAVKDLRQAALNIIPQLMNVMHLKGMWRDFAELNYTQDLLKLIKE